MSHLATESFRRVARAMLLSACAVALLASAGAARAGLQFVELATGVRTEAFNLAHLPHFAVGSNLKLGALATTEPGTVTFTYLGNESGYHNRFHLHVGATQELNEGHAIGTSISAFVGDLGTLSFRFEGSPGLFAANGGAWDPGTSIGLVGTDMTLNHGGAAGTYAYVLGYNDSAGAAKLGDWDDYVVGVNFTPYVQTPLNPQSVPAPHTALTLLLGLGLMGWSLRRSR